MSIARIAVARGVAFDIAAVNSTHISRDDGVRYDLHSVKISSNLIYRCIQLNVTDQVRNFAGPVAIL